MKEIQKPGTQIFLLLLFVVVAIRFVGPIMFSLFYPLFGDINVETIDFVSQPHLQVWIAFFGQLSIFLVCFILFLRLTKQSPKAIIYVDRFNYKYAFMAIGLLTLAWIPVELLESANVWLVEQYPQIGYQQMLMHEEVYEALFTKENQAIYPLALLSMAVFPAIFEELIFRGILLQKLLHVSQGKKHFAVIVSSIFFVAFHVQPFFILPMILMALILGYVYVYTKDIRYGMIIHFLFNGVQITMAFFWPELVA